ncbi:hypothetical protein D9757_000057 [Collybiopsis confluens]|uniref:Uncharacterized protein n=1 Tax=Collybiopsis confluens TaxID=2823264 RepID=A0A8H5I1R0_9AGAR|nr:hypothetical protein D9757_000057 [Collybiopsis confluens]
MSVHYRSQSIKPLHSTLVILTLSLAPAAFTGYPDFLLSTSPPIMSYNNILLDDAINLSHHLSDVARARQISPLKRMQKYIGKPGLISLAGGLPSPEYFPFASISGQVLVPDSFPLKITDEKPSLSWIWNLLPWSNKERTTSFTVPKYSRQTGDLSLETGLQYSLAKGLPQLDQILHEFVSKIFQPGYSNWTTLVHTGNTDGWSKVVQTILNPGDGLLCSEWTYPSAMANAMPYNIKYVPISMDSEGMDSTSLRKTLMGWDESRSMHPIGLVLCTAFRSGRIPQTMSARRKKEIYDICAEYDIIIVEDCPYYFLQEGEYVPKSKRTPEPDVDDDTFITSLVPSYLKYDYQGRVIRLDTFSKANSIP